MDTPVTKPRRAKGPALITRYKAVQAQVETLTAQLAESEKKLKSETGTKESWYNTKCALQSEIEQLHCVFDSLPGAAARKSEGENSWDKKDITVMARLASFLAQRP